MQFVIVAMYASPMPFPQRHTRFTRGSGHSRMVSSFINADSPPTSFNQFGDHIPIFGPVLGLSDRIALVVNLLAAGKLERIGRDNNESTINAEAGVENPFAQMHSTDFHYPSKRGSKLD